MKKRSDYSAEEIDRFKIEIPLADYLATRWGFYCDVKESCRGSLVMRHDDGRKLIVARGKNLSHIYFSVHDATDNGTIVDFCLNHLGAGATLGHVRKELRQYLSGGLNPPAPLPDIRPIEKNLLQVQARYAGYERISAMHPYLTRERGIPSALLAQSRFHNRIRQDETGNVIFPHFDVASDVCGYEIGGHGVKRFSSGGQKGMWLSEAGDHDTTLAIAESTIDALSYFALHGHDRMQVASICGNLNKQQPAIITQMIQALTAGAEIIAAFDHDDGGKQLADQLNALYLAAGCPQIAFKVHAPPKPGQDWNNVLRDAPGSKKKPISHTPHP